MFDTIYNLWKKDVQNILKDIRIEDGWAVMLEEDKIFKDADGCGRLYLQVQFIAPDSVTGIPEHQYCRKWYLSPYMTKQEVVRTAYKAYEGAVLHEMQEKFLYRGRQIYNPHTNVDSLWEVANEIDKRDNH